MACTHEIAEMDVACADGACPICLSERYAEARKENERLRAALETIAYHRDIHSDFPHTIEDMQAFAYNTLSVNEQSG